MRSSRAFTLMEVLVVISIIALLMAILVPGLAMARKMGNQMKSKTQLRAIQNSFVIYSDKNNDWYPGVDNTGANGYYDYIVNDQSTNDGVRVTPGAAPFGPGAVLAFWLLLREAFLLPEDVVSPVDNEKLIFTPDPALIFGGLYSVGAGIAGVRDDDWTEANYSYATLKIADVPGDDMRRRLWRNNGNAQLPIASDRAIDNDDTSGAGNAIVGEIRSIHTNPDLDRNDWSGYIAWNDGHVTQGTDTAETPTRLTDERPTNNDYLFDTADAALQHTLGDY